MRRRDRARGVDCPRCGATAGNQCFAKNGLRRASYHLERHAQSRSQQAQKKPARSVAAKGYGAEWAATRAKVFAAKGAQCEYCGADASHVDHKTPKSRGGTDDMDNLAPCCPACNVSKGSMTLKEWRPD